MVNGFLTALQETGSFLAEWRMAEPEQNSTEWLTSLHSRWRMEQEWNSNFNLYTIMKATMFICGLMAVLCGIAAFFNPDHVWTTAFCGCMAYAAHLEVQKEEEDKK